MVGGYHLLDTDDLLNQVVKGLSRESLLDDPQLGGKRMELVSSAAQKLVATRMIAYDVQNGRFQVTDLGRVAARYYIRYTSIEIFNELFRPQMSEADVLNMMSKSTEVGDKFRFRYPV
jgi:antiviral helicase SLH1